MSSHDCAKECQRCHQRKHGLWIEVKKNKCKLSIHQSHWIGKMKQVGYSADVVFSVDESIQAIKDYLEIRL